MIVVILTLCTLFASTYCIGTNIVYAEENNIVITNENVSDSVSLAKITIKEPLIKCRSNSLQVKVNEVISDYGLDSDLFYKSSVVYKQTETIYSPSEYYIKTTEGELRETSPISKKPVMPPILPPDIDVSTTWSDDEGYMTISTYAYKTGVDQEGDAIYNIKAHYFLHKTFKMRNQDEVTLAHTSNAVLDSNSTMFGEQSYHKYYYLNSGYDDPVVINENVTNELSPLFPTLNSVQYSFKFPVDRSGSFGGSTGYTEKYTVWIVKAQYTIIVSGKTNVQACYFHNENLFGGNLSIGFGVGPVSVSYSVSGTCTKYQATPLLLYNE